MGLIIFEIDSSTAHPGVVINEGIASREASGGWVTLRSTKPLTPSNHQWAVKIIDQGEGNDGSGLMLGLLPKIPSNTLSNLGCKYISELGGWCFSRAGDSYGSWKCDRVPFRTGQVVEFDLDYSTKSLYIVCENVKVVSNISSLNDEVYPAFSLFYRNQKVMFV